MFFTRFDEYSTFTNILDIFIHCQLIDAEIKWNKVYYSDVQASSKCTSSMATNLPNFIRLTAPLNGISIKNFFLMNERYFNFRDSWKRNEKNSYIICLFQQCSHQYGTAAKATFVEPGTLEHRSTGYIIYRLMRGVVLDLVALRSAYFQ